MVPRVLRAVPRLLRVVPRVLGVVSRVLGVVPRVLGVDGAVVLTSSPPNPMPPKPWAVRMPGALFPKGMPLLPGGEMCRGELCTGILCAIFPLGFKDWTCQLPTYSSLPPRGMCRGRGHRAEVRST